MTVTDQQAELSRRAERAHDRETEFGIKANDAAVKAGEEAVKASLLVNGGSSVAMLAFVGTLASRSAVDVSQIVEVARSIIWFAGGLALAVLTTFFTYFTNLFIAGASNARQRLRAEIPIAETDISRRKIWIAEFFRGIAVLAIVGSLLCFCRGVHLTTGAFEVLAKPIISNSK